MSDPMMIQPWAGGWARRSTKEAPLTHGDPENGEGWEWCKCSACALVAVCTPNNDFYTKPADGGRTGPLFCETCIVKRDSPTERDR